MEHSKEFLALAEPARQQATEMDAATVMRWQQEQRDFLLIDVREDHEWQQGHLPDALHLSRGIIERDIIGRVMDFERILVLYCGGGYRSAMAAVNLEAMGYRNVISMAGGFKAWRDAGYPLMDATSAPK